MGEKRRSLRGSGRTTREFVLVWPDGERVYENCFAQRGAAAGSDLAWEKCHHRDFQGAGGGARCLTQAESERRPAGGPDCSWRRVQSGLLLSARALQLLEKGTARTRTADGNVRRELHRPWFA